MNNVVVIAAHPQLDQSRVNLNLLRAAEELATKTGAAQVDVRNLYTLYPDYLIDVAAEQSALGSAQLVVWQHPIQWYSMPALMKLWVDEVLSFGWAYGPGGTALQGKDLWLVVSTGGDENSYHPSQHNRYFFDAFLPPYEQTAALCGMRFLPHWALHGALQFNEEQLQTYAQTYRQRLASYPNWPEMAELQECIRCDVPASFRPAQAADINNLEN